MDGGTHSIRENRKKEAQVPPVIIVWQMRKGHAGRWCGGWVSLFRALYAIRRETHSIRRWDGTRRGDGG